MIHIITEENRHLHRHLLMEMHRQRRAIFMEELRWPLEAPQGLEIDQFDAPDATYLVEAEARTGAVMASLRLLPTERPHLLSEVFAHLCPDGVPRGENIWEVSRFCPSPAVGKGPPRRALLAVMIAGILEAGLLFGVDHVTFVASRALARLSLAIGWDAQPLGPAAPTSDDIVVAIRAAITPAGLRVVRQKNRLGGPLTRFAAPARLPRAA